MSFFMRATRRALLGLSVGFSGIATAEVAGSLVGQFAVQGGGASYSIPLNLPPGLGEMKPELSLVYNSNGGDGPLGPGWSVSGLSAISLCPQTLSVDGVYVPVSPTVAKASQRYCLDGQRLIPTSGTYGSANVVLRPEIDNFSKVTLGSMGSAVPNSFIVKTKAGQELRYGEVAGARSHSSTAAPSPAITWFVNKITDAVGNQIQFNYQRATATGTLTPETLIDTITYTHPAGSGAPHAMVDFDYVNRATPDIYPAGGYRFERTQKLRAIIVSVNGTVVRTYKFGYRALPRTGNEAIDSIQECAGPSNSEACLPATEFTWNEVDIGMQNSTASGVGSWGGDDWVRTGDFNGDGLTDIASPSGGYVYLKLARPYGGFDVSYWTTQNNWPTVDKLMVGDFDGDGRTDFAFPDGNTVRVKYARNGVFHDEQITPTLPAGATMSWGPAAATMVGEFNGDGRADIVTFRTDSPTAQRVLLKSTNGFELQLWNALGVGISNEVRNNFPADLNADGITDFATLSEGSSTDSLIYYISNAQARTVTPQAAVSSTTIPKSDSRLRWVADFDGDGLPEFAIIPNSGNNTLSVFGPSNRAASAWSRTLPYFIPDDRKDWTWAYDYNGDGRTDIVTRRGSELYAYVQTTVGFTSKLAAVATNWGPSNRTWIGDFNGDGMVDLVSRNDSTFVTVASALSTGNAGAYDPDDGSQPEAISQIRSGNGALIRITYRTMAQSPAGNTAGPSTYDNLVVAAPIWLAHEVWSSHGAGDPEQMRGTQYQYFNLRVDPKGRGVLGFESETVRDLLTGDYEVTEFSTAWPTQGMVKRKSSYVSDGTLRKALSQVLASHQPGTNGPVFPYVKTSTETTHDDSGSPLASVITDYATPDSYGNFTSITVTTRNSFNAALLTTTTLNTYEAPNTADWILGRLSNVSVTHAGPVESRTRTSAFTYLPNGLLQTETVEPGQPGTSQWLQTTYEYDTYGNKDLITVSGFDRNGVALPARTTNNAVTVSGNTLTTVTSNTLGHSSTQVMSLIHGGVLSATDANGVVVSFEYDDFGRKTQQSQNGASTTWSYQTSTGEAPNAVLKVVTTDSAGGSGVIYQDLLGRTVRKVTVALDGQDVFEETRYDAQGRVVEGKRPAFDPYSGASVVTQYDDRGRISQIDAPGANGQTATTLYSYNGLTTTTTLPEGRQRIEERNALGQVVRVLDGGLASVDYTYDPVGNLVSTVDAIGQQTFLSYDSRGRKTLMLDPHMGQWQYAYNSFGELEWQQDAKNQITTQVYDVLGRMVSRTEPGLASPSTWTWDTAANGKGKLASVQGQNGHVESYAYDSQSRPIQVTTKIHNNNALETFITSTMYDTQNRVSKVIYPGAFELENVYNAYGYLVALRSPMDTEEEVYDEAALQARIDEILAALPGYTSTATAAAQDAAQYQQAVVDLELEIALVRATAFGTLSQADQDYIAAMETQIGVYRSFATLSQAMADSLMAEAAQLSDYANFYVALASDPLGQVTHWAQLMASRQAALSAMAATVESSADSMEVGAATYQALVDNLQGTIDGITATVLAPVQAQIDALLVQAEQARIVSAAQDAEAERAADELARLQSQLVLLQTNMQDSTHITWWRADQVDAEGRIAQELLGNGLFTRRQYDERTGHLLAIQTGGSTSNLADVQDVGYSYDLNNNVERRWDHAVGLDQTYTYDALDRLSSMVQTHQHTQGGSLDKTLSWGYDDAGNFTHRTENGTVRSYTYAAQTASSSVGGFSTTRQRMMSVQGVGNYRYDGNGNVDQAGPRNVSYNAANQPILLSNTTHSVSYEYGPNRNRLRRVEIGDGKTLETVYAGGYERTLRSGAGSLNLWENRYPIYVGDRLVATRLRTKLGSVTTRRVEYYHEDALNSVEVVTDSVGRIVKRYHYDPFGQRSDITALSGYASTLMRDDPLVTLMLRGFTGHEHIDNLNLIHMNGRVYDTRAGRFLSADPHIQAPYDSQSYNRYSYVKNNPLKYTDPSGYFFKSLFRAIKKYWRPLLAIGITFIPGLNIAAAGFISGMIASGGDLKAGIIGVMTAGMFTAIGSHFQNIAAASKAGVLSAGDRVLKVVAHGAVGGLSQVGNGGKFGHGFLSSGFAQAFAPGIDKLDASNTGMSPIRTITAAIIGGTASELGGGKFANGAVTAAFSRAFNDEKHYSKTVRHTVSGSEHVTDANGQMILKEFAAGDITWVERPFSTGVLGGLFDSASDILRNSWAGRIVGALDPRVEAGYQRVRVSAWAKPFTVQAISDFDGTGYVNTEIDWTTKQYQSARWVETNVTQFNSIGYRICMGGSC